MNKANAALLAAVRLFISTGLSPREIGDRAVEVGTALRDTPSPPPDLFDPTEIDRMWLADDEDAGPPRKDTKRRRILRQKKSQGKQ